MSTDNVVAFGHTIPPGEPNPDIVADLERLLAQAKNGELRGFAYAVFFYQRGASDGMGGF